MVSKKIVTLKNKKFIFQCNIEFGSPSTAAAIILGYPINGRTTWKNSTGKTLKQIEETRIGK